MTVYIKHKLVSSNIDQFTIKDNVSLTNLVDRLNMPEVLYDCLQVSIDSVIIPKENWANTIASTKNVVYIKVIPQGGDSGKNPLAIIAMVALTVFTMGAASPWLASTFGAYAGVAQAGIMFVGMLAINALFPPPVPNTPSSYDDNAGFFGMEGLRNRARPHKAVRSIYGSYKVAPDICAEPFAITTGDTQKIYTIYDFGYGEVDVSNLLIGNTPIDNYTGVTYSLKKNYTDANLDIYKNDHVSESFSTEIQNTFIERIAPSDDSDEIYIDVQFPLGLAKFPEEGGMETHSVNFSLYLEKIVDGSGTGLLPIQSMNSFTTSHGITWPVDFAKSMEFQDLYTHTAGTPGYSLVRVSSTFEVKVYGQFVTIMVYAETLPLEVTQSFVINGITYTITARTKTSTIVNELGSESDFFGIQYQRVDTYNITLDQSTIAGEKIYDEEMWHCIELVPGIPFCSYQYVPQPTQSIFALSIPVVDDFFLTRSTSKPFVFSMNVKFPSQGEWKVYIKRLDAILYEDSASWDDKYSDKTVLTVLQSVTYRQPLAFRVGHTILEMSIQGTDQLAGIVDTLSGFCKRKLPIWNGSSWANDFTSNPAWIALDVLMGDANPDPIPESRIDLVEFKNWADFCDTASAQGDDYHHVDCNWDANSTVFERMLSVMQAGRATHSTRENKFSVIYEQFPTTPSQLLTPHNSWGFKGHKIFTKQPHALNVKFVDPLAEWQMVDLVVYADDYNETNATYFENISLPLCTRSNEAFRNGRYYLASGKLRPENFTVNLDIENLICTRGDLIELQHDVARMGGLSTRVTDISSSPTIKLREPVSWDNIDNYYLRIRFDDNTQDEVQVIGQIDSYTITLTSAPPKLKIGDLCVYGKVDYVTDEYLIKSITPGQDLTAALELIPIARAIANSDTGTIPEYTPPISSDDMLYPVCLTTVKVDGSLYYDHRFPFVDVTISWTAVGTNVLYEIWFSEDNEVTYKLIDTVSTVDSYKIFDRKSTLDIDYNHTIDMYAKVIPINAVGFKPIIDSCNPIVFRLPYDETLPGKPLFFAGNINADTMNLTWLPPVDNDIAGYIIKYTAETTPDWDTSTAQGSLIPYNITSANFNARIGSYMIKTIDTSGNYSTAFGLIKTSIPALQGFDNFQTLTEHATFLGEMSNVELITSTTPDAIRLVQDGGNYVPYGTYTYATIVDLGNIYNAYISCDIARTVYNSGSGATLESDQDVIIQMRMSSENPAIADWVHIEDAVPIGGATPSDWSGWQNLYAGYYTGRHFEFRAVLVSNNVDITPHVYELGIKVDMVERTDAQNDLSSIVNGSTVAFNNEFKDIPAIAITQDNATLGDRFEITNQATDGFYIEFFNVADDSVIRQFDYVAIGYGVLLTSIEKPIEAGSEDDLSLLPSAVSFITRKELLT